MIVGSGHADSLCFRVRFQVVYRIPTFASFTASLSWMGSGRFLSMDGKQAGMINLMMEILQDDFVQMEVKSYHVTESLEEDTCRISCHLVHADGTEVLGTHAHVVLRQDGLGHAEARPLGGCELGLRLERLDEPRVHELHTDGRLRWRECDGAQIHPVNRSVVVTAQYRGQ